MNGNMETLFHNVVIPGSGWPGDPATTTTPVAPIDGEVEELASHAANLQELSARVSVCRACPRLVEWREEVALTKRKAYADQQYWGRPAPGYGDSNASLVIVGLAPAAHGANRTGRVFTGDRTGDFLAACLYRTGFATQPSSVAPEDGFELINARLVSAVRCAPPKNRPSAWEQQMCSPWLDRELQLIQPTVILALGGIGWKATIQALKRLGFQVPSPQPRFGHAAQFRAHGKESDVDVVGSYHPSQQNTFTGRLTSEMLEEVLITCQKLTAE